MHRLQLTWSNNAAEKKKKKPQTQLLTIPIQTHTIYFNPNYNIPLCTILRNDVMCAVCPLCRFEFFNSPQKKLPLWATSRPIKWSG